MEKNKRLVWKALKTASQNYPNKPFLLYRGKTITYQELDQISDKLAYSFLRIGIKRGDNIAIIALNQPEWLYAYFAASKIGAGLVALNVRYRESELEYMLNNSKATALICLKEFGGFSYSDFFYNFREKVPTVKKYIFIGGQGFKESIGFESLLEKNGKNESESKILTRAMDMVEETDTVMIVYTSGTTGKPKGVMLTNKSILASGSAQAEHFKFTGNDLMIGSLPLNHVGGITCTITASLVSGGTVVLVPSFHPKEVLEATDKHKVTIFAGVPTMYVMVLNYSDFKKYDLSSVRMCIVGGSNVEPQLCQDISKNFPNARVMNLYGLSETSGACVLSRLDDGIEKVSESIGVVIDNFKVKVVDDKRQELPTGEIGELAFKGDCVAKGYFGLEEETRESFGLDGWLYTGDVGYLDEDGYVYLKGRKKEMYIQGGFNVYPAEIENLLIKHPKVAVAAGIGVPDPVFGEVGRFYIIPKEGMEVTEDELMKYCREKLADYKVPKQFVFVKELPLTPAGKINKSLIKQWYHEKGF
jgi:fatty-acyl-CoA synthase